MVEQSNPARDEGEVLAKLRKELAQEDFVSIFGSKAKFSSFIGSW